MNDVIIAGVLTSIILFGGLATVVAGDQVKTAHSETSMVSANKVEFVIQYIPHRSLLTVDGYNPSRSSINTGIIVSIDGKRMADLAFQVEGKEHWQKTWNITSSLDPLETNHTVTVSTFGNYTQFNFTREIDAAESDAVVTPYIANVTVTNGTIDGEPSAVAEVTVANPSIHTYPMKLMVHTLGTDGSFYGASVRPGETRTITVELLDDRGEEIAGEARLYTGNLTKRDGGLDQVEFVGEADDGTAVWNRSYRPVKPTWMNDHYQYTNDSYSPGIGDRIRGLGEVGGVPVLYVALGVLVVLVGLRKIRG